MAVPAIMPMSSAKHLSGMTVGEYPMTEWQLRLDAMRRGLDDMQNHVVDEFLAGHIGRRGLLRHGGAYGLSAALMGLLLGGALDVGLPGAARAAAKTNATIRVALTTPTGAVDPMTVDDIGGLALLQQAGEFLTFDDPKLHLKPMLATSWKANKDGTVWTFSLRKGVKFHNGHAMTADDVVYSIARLADPKQGSNALSTFKGVLLPDGVKKVDAHTVAFHLQAPNGNFPYLLSSDNYNAIIVPKGSDPKQYQKDFVGTGPFKIEKFVPGSSASFVRNDDYWGGPVGPARVVMKFYDDQQSQVLALQGGEVDVIQQIVVQGAQGLLHDPSVKILDIHATTHREVHMRCDKPPFTDKRVRRALALTLNRKGIIRGLMEGRAQLGNDSPFSPLYPSTNRTVPQRHADLAEAKKLVHAAGLKPGTEVQLDAPQLQEIPDYAVLIQNAAAEIGLKINIKTETTSAYYGQATFGNSDWLDSTMGITDYGHRGVPNVFLGAPLMSDGTWNAAHFKNKTYDKLAGDYIAALDLAHQRHYSGRIERLLLDETPIIYAYFYDYLAATKPHVTGVVVTGMSQVFLKNATKT